MGECGCTMNDARYRLPGQGKTLYIITLSGHCTYCDAPAGVTIEMIDEKHSLFREYKHGEFNCERLCFEDWPDSKGVAITVGYRKHEFVKAIVQHLIGIKSADLGEDGSIDADGADCSQGCSGTYSCCCEACAECQPCEARARFRPIGPGMFEHRSSAGALFACVRVAALFWWAVVLGVRSFWK